MNIFTGVAMLFNLCAKLIMCLQVFLSTPAWKGVCNCSAGVSHHACGVKLAFSTCMLQCLHCTDEAHIGRNRGSPVCITWLYLNIGQRERVCCVVCTVGGFMCAHLCLYASVDQPVSVSVCTYAQCTRKSELGWKLACHTKISTKSAQ